MAARRSIFDLVALCVQVSKHDDHSVTIDYCGLVDKWTYYVHQRGSSDVLRWAHVVDDDPIGDHQRTLEQAYAELKEYLP